MYLHRLRIDGVRGFSGPRAVDLDFELNTEGGDVFDRYRGFVVIAGRNGSGKTTLLRAAAAAMAGPEVANSLTEGDRDWVSHGSSLATVRADIARDEYEVTLSGRGRAPGQFPAPLKWEHAEGTRSRPQADFDDGGAGGRMAERSLWSQKPTGWFAAGYGPFRRLAGTSGEVARLMAGDWTVARFATLFREEASLAETVQWLQQVNYRARSGREEYAELEHRMLALLNDGLFPDGYRADRVDPDGLWIVKEGSPPVRIDEMSDGYRTVTALVTDIVRQTHECFDGNAYWDDSGAPVNTTSGVVLIDEIDVHLHLVVAEAHRAVADGALPVHPVHRHQPQPVHLPERLAGRTHPAPRPGRRVPAPGRRRRSLPDHFADAIATPRRSPTIPDNVVAFATSNLHVLAGIFPACDLSAPR